MPLDRLLVESFPNVVEPIAGSHASPMSPALGASQVAVAVTFVLRPRSFGDDLDDGPQLELDGDELIQRRRESRG